MLENIIENPSLLNNELISFNSLENRIVVSNPSNGEFIANVAKLNQEQLQKVIIKANETSYNWSMLTAFERSNYLVKWAELLIVNKLDLARVLTSEQGKPLIQAITEIGSCIDLIKYFSEEAKRIYGKIIASRKPNQQISIEYEPVGLVGGITPWNFPASMIIRKAAPALAAGCAIVIKPSDLTPLTAFALAKLAYDVGIPRNVINIVTGDSIELGKELTENELIKKISFTGSTKVGKELIKQCASTVKRMSMELGGDAPYIIFTDCDIDKSVKGLILAKLRNNGQTCICPNKIFIQDQIYDAALKQIIAAVSKLTIGEGLDNPDLGPLISTLHLNKIEELLKDALKNGAQIHYGGNKLNRIGNYFEPTILTLDINSDAKINQEEIFGPIFNIYKFQTEEEVINSANRSKYGLAGYVYTKDFVRANRVSKKLECGMIGINEWAISHETTAFGGIKESGFGREGSFLGIYEYLNVKYICNNF